MTTQKSNGIQLYDVTEFQKGSRLINVNDDHTLLSSLTLCSFIYLACHRQLLPSSDPDAIRFLGLSLYSSLNSH